MVTIRNKTKSIKTYNLTCAIALAGVAVEKDEKGFERAASERVLTILAGEKREGLPNEVLESPEVKAAISKGDLKVLSQDEPSFEAAKASPAFASKPYEKTKGAKSSAALKSTEE